VIPVVCFRRARVSAAISTRSRLGKNIGIVWGGRTSLNAGGERAGRSIYLTVDDARALATESSMIAVVSPEIQRGGIKVKSAYNAAALTVHGIEPQYQAIRTIDIERGRPFRDADNEHAWRVAIIGADATAQLFSGRDSIGQTVELNLPSFRIAESEEGSGRQLQRTDSDRFVPFSAMIRD
jgi:putative ABC transport system permease protein